MADVGAILLGTINKYLFIFAATKPSEVHRKCLEEVQKISQATLFAPVLHCEAVQAMSEQTCCY